MSFLYAAKSKSSMLHRARWDSGERGGDRRGENVEEGWEGMRDSVGHSHVLRDAEHHAPVTVGVQLGLLEAAEAIELRGGGNAWGKGSERV